MGTQAAVLLTDDGKDVLKFRDGMPTTCATMLWCEIRTIVMLDTQARYVGTTQPLLSTRVIVMQPCARVSPYPRATNNGLRQYEAGVEWVVCRLQAGGQVMK